MTERWALGGTPCSLNADLIVSKIQLRQLRALRQHSSNIQSCSLSADLIAEQLKDRKAWAMRQHSFATPALI
jgi:hypothetical protein